MFKTHSNPLIATALAVVVLLLEIRVPELQRDDCTQTNQTEQPGAENRCDGEPGGVGQQGVEQVHADDRGDEVGDGAPEIALVRSQRRGLDSGVSLLGFLLGHLDEQLVDALDGRVECHSSDGAANQGGDQNIADEGVGDESRAGTEDTADGGENREKERAEDPEEQTNEQLFGVHVVFLCGFKPL